VVFAISYSRTSSELLIFMKIARIVSSNSHLDYVGRVIDEFDSNDPPKADDYGFAQFVKITLAETNSIIGIIYDSVLINPEYANFGPRLSPKPELSSFSPDYLNEQGVLIGILLLGSIENGKTSQGVPRRIVPAGLEVFAMTHEEVIEFHSDDLGSLQLHYYSQIIANAGVSASSLIESIVEQLSKTASETEKNRLNVLKHSLVWQRTVGGMRL
jgi:hypothetical protein